MGYIYKITNLINNKLYIGKTVTSIAHRWDQHKSAAKNRGQWALYKAIRKYGEDNFSIEMIEEVDNDNLNNREIYWINYYNSYRDGYNMTLGGDGRISLNRNKIIELWNNGCSVQTISKNLNCWVSSVIDILKEQNIYDPERIKKERIINTANSQSQHKIIQYNENGEIINIFNSCKEAAEHIGGFSDTIHGGITTKGSRYGYYWAYEDAKELPNFRPIKRSIMREVYQYSLNGDFVNCFNSAAEAKRKTGIDSSSILRVCKGQRKTAGGYKWSYDLVE